MFSSACMQVRVACSNTTDQSMLSYCVGSVIDPENAANASRHARANAPVAVDSGLYKLYLRVRRRQ